MNRVSLSAKATALFLVYVISFAVALPVLAQSTVIGTGRDGCYFGECSDSQTSDQNGDKPPERAFCQEPNRQLFCVTYTGSCVMVNQTYPVNDPCHCNTLSGSKDGRTQCMSRPSFATMCWFAGGSCPLSVPIAAGAGCWCPTYYGPQLGTAR